MYTKVRRILALILLVIFVLLILWAALPNRRQTVSLSPSEMQLPTAEKDSVLIPTETRQVRLEWPGSMHISEREIMTLIYEPSVTEAASDSQQPDSSSVYDSYNIMAEAKFEVAGINMSPTNPTRESMPAGQTVKFIWQISADKVGIYDGNVWLSLRFLPLNGGLPSQIPIFIRQVRIQTSRLLGMSEKMAYSVGGAGFIMCLIIIFDDMIGFVRPRMRILFKKDTISTKE